jgi:hypothetical protein
MNILRRLARGSFAISVPEGGTGELSRETVICFRTNPPQRILQRLDAGGKLFNDLLGVGNCNSACQSSSPCGRF